MTISHVIDTTSTDAAAIIALSATHRRTLEAFFRHPLAHNLEWRDLVALISDLGEVEEKANGQFVLEIAGHRHVMLKPHTKNLTTSDTLDVRRFLELAGLSPEQTDQPVAQAAPPAPCLLIVLDHQDAKIFEVDVTSDRASEHVLRPQGEPHVRRHSLHSEQSPAEEQRFPEDPDFYETIASAVATGGKIVVIGHGTGKSNAAHLLTDYLKTHHLETYLRIVSELTADLSHITNPQLLDLARDALRS